MPYVSAAQRKAVWASKKDGGAGHPKNKNKKKSPKKFLFLLSGLSLSH